MICETHYHISRQPLKDHTEVVSGVALFFNMISEQYVKKYCSEDPSLIKNYNEAISDNTQVWDLHHIAEITEDGITTVDELIEKGLYFHRPACELIYLTHTEHTKLHSNKRPPVKHTQESRDKIAKARTGTHHSIETRHKMSASLKGRHHSEETKKKISNSNKGKKFVLGKHWYNNGSVNILANECPKGFRKGRIK